MSHEPPASGRGTDVPTETRPPPDAPSSRTLPARSRRARRLWSAVRFLVSVALGALALWALNGDRNELVGASSELAHLRVGWVVLAVGAEIASLLSFTSLQQRLLRAGGTRAGLGWMTSVSLATLTIASSVPAGPAVSSIFVFRQYRRKGADDALAGWTILSTLVFASLGLALLASVGVLIAYSESAGYDLVGVVFGVLLVTVGADAVVWQRRWLARLAIFLLGLSRRLIKRPRRDGLVIVEGLVGRLAAVRLNWRDLVASVLAGIGNWTFDCGCLAFAFLAVGSPVPWHGLLLAYGAGQLAANLPITPGGLGIVENSLTIALVAFGGAQTSTVAAVLLYRVITFWGYLPLGWLDWAVLRLAQRRTDRISLAPAGEPSPGAAIMVQRATAAPGSGPVPAQPSGPARYEALPPGPAPAPLPGPVPTAGSIPSGSALGSEVVGPRGSGGER